MSRRLTRRLPPSLLTTRPGAYSSPRRLNRPRSNDIVWLTSDSTQELTCAISDIATAVACPVCNESLGLSLTVIFFSLRQVQMDRKIVEFVFHMR